MSEFDATTAKLLKGTVFPMIVGLLLLVLFLKNFKGLSHRYFAWFYMLCFKGYKSVLQPQKELLFRPLHNFKSLDWNLRNQGLIRILEVGVGPGSNFEFYPKNARVIAVDPNPYFKRYLDENKAEFPEIKLEKFILGQGEDLSELADGSVDVVVTTAVLCSVHDLDTTLREIHRVLAPGGMYFFLEHVVWPKKTDRWKRIVQRLANIVWPFIFDGCKVTVDVKQAIQKTGFENAQFKRFIIPGLPKLCLVTVGSHIYGTAQKIKTA